MPCTLVWKVSFRVNMILTQLFPFTCIRWHAVLNLTHTVGITQNYCSGRNFDEVWAQTRSGRKRLAWKWLGQLEQRYPRLAERARALNARDKFIMKYDPVAQKMRQDFIEHLEQKRQWHKREEKEEEKKEANNAEELARMKDGGATPLMNAGIKPRYIPTSSQIAHLDREWKRIRISDPRAVSPPTAETQGSPSMPAETQVSQSDSPPGGAPPQQQQRRPVSPP